MNELQIPEKNTKGLNAVTQAIAIIINSNESYLAADSFCASLKELEKEVMSTFRESREKAWAAHKSVVAAENRHLEPIAEARKIIKAKLDIWRKKMEDERRAEEDRLRLEAKKRAEDEALRAAEAAMAMGDKSEAEAILSEPLQVPTIVLPKATPKTQTTLRPHHTFKVKDPSAVKREYWIIDESAVDAIVRKMGKAAETIIGGIEVETRMV